MTAARAPFPRRARLTGPAQYGRVFKQTEQRSSDSAVLVLAVSKPSGRARLGLAISKKNVRLATVRNRVKRLVRETFRTHPVSNMALDIVVVARPAIGKCGNAQLRKALERHFAKLSRS